ncbi:Serine--pyruvate aminotransferase, mitochondrial [Mizuhopecten yessoensis]|uniref:Alanine--glyoxylate aminotransferase n=2 Tax=Mizuhopecten yessoensis TaxID=6573 RepID=A0A210QD96_MIZYE|nr:Serine--pyruvate aminotransferase, mitochondrial [Mizuhopecten yessoensis]
MPRTYSVMRKLSIHSTAVTGNRLLSPNNPHLSALTWILGAKMSSLSPPPESLFHPMDIPRKLLMGPGPSNCPPRILNAGALPALGHLHPEFTKIMDEVKNGIKYAFQTKNNWTVCVSGTGHAAMEAACCNLLQPGETTLVSVNGLWGDRFADMASRNDAVVQKIKKPMGQVFNLAEIEEGLRKYRPALLFLTHGESSGSTLQPLEGVGKLCHKYNCLLLVDSVAALGGVPMYMDDWEIDVMYTGAQKVLSAPPGASPISFSDKARAKVLARTVPVRSFYFDMNHLANYWGCGEGPRRYHHTGPISSIYALREGLSRLAEEGLEASWSNHKRCAEMLHEGVASLGLELLVKDKSARLPCVTAIRVPSDVNWKHVTDYAMNTYRVEISGGLGDLAGKVWRVGIMGYNATPDNVKLVLRALKEGIALDRQTHAKL